jgi:hypothetical protein
MNLKRCGHILCEDWRFGRVPSAKLATWIWCQACLLLLLQVCIPPTWWPLESRILFCLLVVVAWHAVGGQHTSSTVSRFFQKNGMSVILHAIEEIMSFTIQVRILLITLTPKGPMSIDGFLGSSGRLSRRQKHEWSFEILEEGGPM